MGVSRTFDEWNGKAVGEHWWGPDDESCRQRRAGANAKGEKPGEKDVVPTPLTEAGNDIQIMERCGRLLRRPSTASVTHRVVSPSPSASAVVSELIMQRLLGRVRLCVQRRACLSTQVPFPNVPTKQRDDGGITVGDVDLDSNTVDHFLQSVGVTSEEDVNEFRRLADKHLSNVDFDAVDKRKLNPEDNKNIGDLKADLVQHVAEVTDDTVEAMVDELVDLYQEQLTELAPSSNPSYAEFPVRDIASDSIDDPDLVDAVVNAFHKRMKEMKSKSQSPAPYCGDTAGEPTAAVVHEKVEEMKSISQSQAVLASGDTADKATEAEFVETKPVANI